MSPHATRAIHARRATLADLDALVPLFEGYRRFYGEPSQPAVCHAFLSERLERGESVVFIATRGNDPVGFVQLYPVFSSVRARRAWLLNDLYVAESTRGSGIGRALLDAARDHASDSDAAYLLLETAHDNHQAQRLYERYGFQRLDPAQRFYQFNVDSA